jgi:hypothetical protein
MDEKRPPGRDRFNRKQPGSQRETEQAPRKKEKGSETIYLHRFAGHLSV